MPTQKLSDFAAETEFDYDDLLYLVRGGNSRKIAASDFRKAVFDPRNALNFFDDFYIGNTTIVNNRRWSVDTVSFSYAADHGGAGTLGVQSLVGSSGPSFAMMFLTEAGASNNPKYHVVPSSTFPTICEWRVRLSHAPSATDPAYFCRFGMRSISSYSTDTTSCHGVWAELYHNGTAPVWKLVAEAAGSKTSSDASVGITTNAWHKVAMVYTTSNAYLFLDGTQIASLSSGLPTEGASPCLAARKNSGVGITISFDYVWVFQPLTSGR